jgi:hypothetical protein
VANEGISYLEMCRGGGTSLQSGMNCGLGGDPSVVLMSDRALPTDTGSRMRGPP